MRTAFGTKEPVSEPKTVATPPTSLSAPTPPKVEKTPAARKPLKIGDCRYKTPLKLFGENFSREPEVGRNTLNVIMIF